MARVWAWLSPPAAGAAVQISRPPPRRQPAADWHINDRPRPRRRPRPQDNCSLFLNLDFINGGEMFSHLRRMGRFR